jgi:hemerythrin-like metal-binding protein
MTKIGIKSIDDDHERIIKEFDKFYKIMDDREISDMTKSSMVTQIIKSAGDHLQRHFAEEETYMEKIKYPKIREHINGHAILMGQYKQFIKEFMIASISQQKILVTDFVNTFRFNIIEHIDEVDSQLPTL